jgi:nucleotide-binding universal stress UspA family protein
MASEPPIVLALALDAEAHDVTRAAAELAKRTDSAIAPVHALGWRPLESDEALGRRISQTREKVMAHLAPFMDESVEVLEPVIARARPAELVVETASSLGAQMIVTGGGGPATVRRWVVGSNAERIVRSAPVPVFIARGVPLQRTAPVLCPIDLSPQSRIGLSAAIRMARLFECPLVTITVIPEDEHGWLSAADLEHELEREENAASEQVGKFIRATDFGDVDVSNKVVVGHPAQRIVEESQDAWLLVIASRAFTDLVPGNLGGVTERVLRFSRCSALTLRDSDPARDEREASVRKLADLKERADRHVASGAPDRALPLLQLAVGRAPANAALQEALADVLEAVGRADEAESRRNLAKVIRTSFG